MKILVACETSGIVREAFNRAGHDAWSCDILPSDTPTNKHITGDVRDVVEMDTWDMLYVAHPPCTRLTNSGCRWLIEPCNEIGGTYSEEQREAFKLMNREEKLDFLWTDLQAGAELFSFCLNVDKTHGIKHIAVENPVMHKHAKARIKGYFKFSQSVQPWHFAEGDDSEDNVKKRTCLWLKNLPNLVATGNVDGSTARADCHNATPGKDRWKIRSKFYDGIANAMADQWGSILEGEAA
tara:strand:- start:13398 stop:14111 length:714 start_codon:yes stop_codon:yes gene_type:complete